MHFLFLSFISYLRYSRCSLCHSFFQLAHSYHPYPTFSSLSISLSALSLPSPPLIVPLFSLHSYSNPLSPLIHFLPLLIPHFPHHIHPHPSSIFLLFFPSLSNFYPCLSTSPPSYPLFFPSPLLYPMPQLCMIYPSNKYTANDICCGVMKVWEQAVAVVSRSFPPRHNHSSDIYLLITTAGPPPACITLLRVHSRARARVCREGRFCV